MEQNKLLFNIVPKKAKQNIQLENAKLPLKKKARQPL